MFITHIKVEPFNYKQRRNKYQYVNSLSTGALTKVVNTNNSQCQLRINLLGNQKC